MPKRNFHKLRRQEGTTPTAKQLNKIIVYYIYIFGCGFVVLHRRLSTQAVIRKYFSSTYCS